MQRHLLIKAVLVALVFVVLLVPLAMIGGIVDERAARQYAVAQEIADSSYGRQVVTGPVLSLPYVEEYENEFGTGREKTVQRHRLERMLRVFPATTDMRGSVVVSEKRRGLFKVRTFAFVSEVRGEFVLDGSARIERTREGSRITWGPAVVTLGLSDPRGLVGTPVLDWDGQRLAFERGSGAAGIDAGVHATAPVVDPTRPQRHAFTLQLALQGTQSLAIVPVADDNRVRIASNWPHPKFTGQFLPRPDSQQVGKDGFSAEWAVTSLASRAQEQIRTASKPAPPIEQIEVGFIEPIDIYSLSDRALKYGFLFVGLTFGCFFLFEVLKRLPIHPAQYALVGLALATFFLLLIALSEHIAFGLAYAIAATACIALLGFYLGVILRRARRGVAFAAMLAVLYGALYGLLISEDSALLLGATLVFAVIAAAMVLTRHVDWYRVGAQPAPA